MKNRILTVTQRGETGNNYLTNRHSEEIPGIFLKGLWLKECGFNIGDKVNVECESGKLIITLKQ